MTNAELLYIIKNGDVEKHKRSSKETSFNSFMWEGQTLIQIATALGQPDIV